jgi:hypothetical protein
MHITVRHIGKYAAVVVTDSNITIDLGLLTAQEQENLAYQLRDAADDLHPIESISND